MWKPITMHTMVEKKEQQRQSLSGVVSLMSSTFTCIFLLHGFFTLDLIYKLIFWSLHKQRRSFPPLRESNHACPPSSSAHSIPLVQVTLRSFPVSFARREYLCIKKKRRPSEYERRCTQEMCFARGVYKSMVVAK
jgi:hypothetical protein